jgi:hypothetical protein
MASIPRPRQADGSAVGNRCSAGRLDWSDWRATRGSAISRRQRLPAAATGVLSARVRHVAVGGIGTTDGPGATKGGYGLRRTPSVLLPSVLPHDGRDLQCGRERSAAGLVPSAAWSAVGARERAKSDRSPEPAA